MSTVLNNSNTTPHWQAPEQIPATKRPSQQLWSWLTETGSLTNRLRQHYGADLALHLLGETLLESDPEQATVPTTQQMPKSQLFCREVTIQANKTPLVFARTLAHVPAGGENDHWLLQQGDNPLGDTLFAQINTQRKKLEIAQLRENHTLYKDAAKHTTADRIPVWARRSVIHSSNALALLIVECFYASHDK